MIDPNGLFGPIGGIEIVSVKHVLFVSTSVPRHYVTKPDGTARTPRGAVAHHCRACGRVVLRGWGRWWES